MSEGDSSADEDDATQSRLQSMLGSSGRTLAQGPWQWTYYGPYSATSIVLRTLELFRTIPETADLKSETFHAVTGLFEAPSPDVPLDLHRGQFLPTHAATLDLVDMVFAKCHPLVQFLNEANFREMVELLYTDETARVTSANRHFQPLLHAVLALGFWFDVPGRRNHGCEEIRKTA
jgi:hypothetical protein